MNAILINTKNEIKEVKMVLNPGATADGVSEYWWSDADGNLISKVGEPTGEWQELTVDFKDREGLGIYMKQLRLSSNKSVRGLAEECNLSPATIVNIEAGKFTPRMEIINKILTHLTGSRLCITNWKFTDQPEQ